MKSKLVKGFIRALTGKKKKTPPQGPKGPNIPGQALSSKLVDNKKELDRLFVKCSDTVTREFVIASNPPARALVFFVDGLIDKEQINNFILKPLMLEGKEIPEEQAAGHPLELIESTLLPNLELKKVNSFAQAVSEALEGSTLVLVDGSSEGFALGTRGWQMRGLDEPVTEPVVRGPREGFIESIRVNTSLIRRRIKSPSLKMENMQIGNMSKTNVAVAYLEGVVQPALVDEVISRLKRIDIDGVLESGYLTELITDEPFTLFPMVLSTERPDKVASHILEGRVAIVVDTSPFVLIAPTTYFMALQSPEDYFSGYLASSLVRMLRFLAFHIALVLPSAYVAITTYHQEMLPTTLLLSLARAREGVPFPAVVEALLMEGTFEILREAGVRLPRPVGQAISIVGALVIGEAAVRAGLVSPAMVIVVAATAISSFVMPDFQTGLAIRFLRFPLMIASATLGLFGLMAGMMALLIHLTTLRSFGVPYLSPLIPSFYRDWKDMIVRAPWFWMRHRPRLSETLDPVRQASNLMPRKPKPGQGGA